MKASFYPEEDILYVNLSDKPFAYGRDLDDARHLNCSQDGSIIGIEFLYVSQGVDLSDIPDEVVRAISPILESRGVRVFA
jgi:uncharacterized protein YuzE